MKGDEICGRSTVQKRSAEDARDFDAHVEVSKCHRWEDGVEKVVGSNFYYQILAL